MGNKSTKIVIKFWNEITFNLNTGKNVFIHRKCH